MDQESPGSARKRGLGLSRAVLGGTIALAVAAGIFFGLKRVGGSYEAPPPPISVEIPAEATAELRRTAQSFRAIAQKIGPAVVNITATQASPAQEALEGMGEENPLEEFFEHFGIPFGGSPFGGMPEDRGPQSGVGSGFIIDKSGVFVTNNHVVENSSKITVKIGEQELELKATLLGSDARTDVAVLKIEQKGEYPFVEWADSDAVEVGDWAVAIGSPFALGQTVTTGIISAKGRNAEGLSGDYGGDMIQTDAAINPGNSGGPLCNLEGKVIGVNSAIYTRSGGFMGIGFAIPSNTARDIASRLMKEGKIVRGWLGVLIQPLDQSLAEELKLENGVGIHEVIENSPAEKAGLQAGDILLSIDGQVAKDVNTVQKTIGNRKPGEVLNFRVMSYTTKKIKTFTVKIAVLPDMTAKNQKTLPPEEDPIGLKLEESRGKVTITAVDESGIGAGELKAGDIILRINRIKIDSLATYRKAVTSGAQKYFFEIQRDGRTLFLQIAP